jgi:hypothetical protein
MTLKEVIDDEALVFGNKSIINTPVTCYAQV